MESYKLESYRLILLLIECVKQLCSSPLPKRFVFYKAALVWDRLCDLHDLDHVTMLEQPLLLLTIV